MAFAACSSETLDSADKRKEESVIHFGNLDTRATISQASDITEFGVFAEQTVGDDDDESAYVKLLENERVYLENGIWTYDNKRYWIDNRTFHFFAVYPYFNPSKVQPVDLVQSGITYSGYQINFETPSTADQDLLVDMATVRILGADKIANNENDEELCIGYPTVNFDFTHILSKINLKVAKHAQNSGDDNVIKITSLTINGMRSSGSYSVSRSSSYIANWSNLTGAMRYSATFEDKEIEVKGTKLLGDGLLLIPQSIAVEQIAITISYDYYVNGSVNDSFTATTYIPAGSWVADTEYVYTMTLNAVDNNIYFSAPQISPWGEREVGGSIVIM